MNGAFLEAALHSLSNGAVKELIRLQVMNIVNIKTAGLLKDNLIITLYIPQQMYLYPGMKHFDLNLTCFMCSSFLTIHMYVNLVIR